MKPKSHKYKRSVLALGLMFCLCAHSTHAGPNEKKCLSDNDVKKIQTDLEKELFKKLTPAEIDKIKNLDKRAMVNYRARPFLKVIQEKTPNERVLEFNKIAISFVKSETELDKIKEDYESIFADEVFAKKKLIYNENELRKYFSAECELEKQESKLVECAKILDKIFTKDSPSDNKSQIEKLSDRTSPNHSDNQDVFKLLENKLDKKNYISYLNLLNYTKNRYLQESLDPVCGLKDSLESRCKNLRSLDQGDKSLEQILNMYGPLMGANIGADAKKAYDDFNLDKSCKEFLTGFLKENPKSHLSKICTVIKNTVASKPKTAKEHYDAGRVPTYDHMNGTWVWEEPKSTGTMIAGTAAQVLVGEFLPFWMNQKFVVEPSINYSLNQALDLKMGVYLQNLAYQNWMNTVMFPTTLNFWTNGTAKGFGF